MLLPDKTLLDADDLAEPAAVRIRPGADLKVRCPAD
jgi:hypothetical protein